MNETWKAPDAGRLERIVLDVYELLADFCDDPETATLGELPRKVLKQSNAQGGRVIVGHETEPWGVEITFRTIALPLPK